MVATRVVLELEVGSDPLRGWLQRDGGPRRDFEGWLDLARLLVEVAGGGGTPRAAGDDRSRTSG